MCFYSGDEDWTSLQYKPRKARKRHECEECDQPINPGDVYRYGAGLFEGQFHEMKVCARCEFVRELIASVERSRGCAEYEAYPPYGSLGSDWIDGGYAAELGLYDTSDDDAEPPRLREVARW